MENTEAVKMRTIDLDADKIKEQYASGESCNAMAKLFGVSTNTVIKRLKGLGVEIRIGKEAWTEKSKRRIGEATTRQQTGKRSKNWKGGIERTGAGYLIVHCPTHPFVNKRGYVMQHRLVMEKHLGRMLLPMEIVHHINGILDDNRIENLALFSSQGEHARHHIKGIKRSEETRRKISESQKKRLRGGNYHFEP